MLATQVLFLSEEVLIILATIGTVALCSGIVWILPQIVHRIKHKRYKPTIEELKIIHLKEMQKLNTKHLLESLKNANTKITNLENQQQETLNKLINRI